jgi:hypothetical protein
LSAACSAAVRCYMEVADPHHFYADSDTAPHQSDANLSATTDMQTLQGPLGHFERFRTTISPFQSSKAPNADPDLTFYANVDPH